MLFKATFGLIAIFFVGMIIILRPKFISSFKDFLSNSYTRLINLMSETFKSLKWERLDIYEEFIQEKTKDGQSPYLMNKLTQNKDPDQLFKLFCPQGVNLHEKTLEFMKNNKKAILDLISDTQECMSADRIKKALDRCYTIIRKILVDDEYEKFNICNEHLQKLTPSDSMRIYQNFSHYTHLLGLLDSGGNLNIYHDIEKGSLYQVVSEKPIFSNECRMEKLREKQLTREYLKTGASNEQEAPPNVELSEDDKRVILFSTAIAVCQQHLDQAQKQEAQRETKFNNKHA